MYHYYYPNITKVYGVEGYGMKVAAQPDCDPVPFPTPSPSPAATPTPSSSQAPAPLLPLSIPSLQPCSARAYQKYYPRSRG